MIRLFKRKPVVLEGVVFKYKDDCIEFLKQWSGGKIGLVHKNRYPNAKAEMQLLTLEDGSSLKVAHIATEGDIIMKGVSGEVWAVKPDIHAATYEEVV